MPALLFGMTRTKEAGLTSPQGAVMLHKPAIHDVSSLTGEAALILLLSVPLLPKVTRGYDHGRKGMFTAYGSPSCVES